MSGSLGSPPVANVLERLFARSQRQDGTAKQRVLEREEQLGRRLGQAEKYELYGDAPLAISREVGQLLYVLVRSRPTGTIVEYGASLGISTIHLAAAIHDRGQGSLITTEIRPDKAELARRNLADAGFDDLVELREGDALDTLKDLGQPLDFLFLDGRNDLYLSVLRLVEPQLMPGALVAADLSADPDLQPYLQHVRDPAHGYVSACVPLDVGVELSVRTGEA